MIRLENISYAYDPGVETLTDISFEIQAGEFIGFLGPNSSGKSTLLRVLSGLLTPARGKVFIGRRPLLDWSIRERARHIAVVSTEEYFAFPFTVEQVVMMGRTPYLRYGRFESDADRSIVQRSLEAADAWHLRSRPIQHLSSGERQRVLLARALAQEPQILLLDEPNAHLDIGHQWAIFELLKQLHRDHHLTVVCALHDIALAAAYADRLYLLKEGRVYASGKSRDVLTADRVGHLYDAPVDLVWQGDTPLLKLTPNTIKKEFSMNRYAVFLSCFILSSSYLWADPITPVAPPETATVAATGVDYSSATGVTEHSGDSVFISLTRDAVSQKRLPTNTDTVTPDLFKKFDAQNAGQAVAHQTSVRTLPLGGLSSAMTASIRGSNTNQTLVLVDGRPYTGVSLGTPDLSEIPVESIDHIEIVRGGLSALYGANAMGGVINVITKRATYAGHPISHVNVEGRSYGGQTYRLDFGSRLSKVDYFFYADQQRESGFRDNSDSKRHNIGGNAGISMGKAGKIQFDASSFHSDQGTPSTDPGMLNPSAFNNDAEKFATTPFARQITDTNYLRSSYIVPLPMNSLLTLRLFGSQREAEYNDPTFVIHTDRHEQSKGGEAQINLPYGFLAGGSFIRDRLDSEDKLTPVNSFIHSTEDWGVFLQEHFEWRFLTIIPSGRYDHHSQAGESKNPRVQMLADATPWLRFSGSAGRSFRAPTLDDLFTNSGGFFQSFGDPNLRPEKAWTYDAGFELHQDSSSLQVTYFRSNVSDLIESVAVSPFVFRSMNIGQARRQGLEIRARHWFAEWVSNDLNYTYLQNIGRPSGYDHYVALPFSPKHTINDIVSFYPAKKWQIDSTFRFEDKRYGYGVDEGNSPFNTKLASQLLWDLRVAYQVRQAKLYVGLNDVTDKRYEEQPGFPLPGRNFYGGIELKLWD